jgi:hypothetical protein
MVSLYSAIRVHPSILELILGTRKLARFSDFQKARSVAKFRPQSGIAEFLESDLVFI